MTFSNVLLLSEGRTLYMGPGGLAPTSYFLSQGLERCPEGYNVADWLLDIASDSKGMPTSTVVHQHPSSSGLRQRGEGSGIHESDDIATANSEEKLVESGNTSGSGEGQRLRGGEYATTFLTQFEVLAGREWKTLKRYALLGLIVALI